MKWIGLALAAAGLACAELTPAEMRREGEQALLACGEHRVDTSMCLSLEVIQAEYDLCMQRDPDPGRCDEVWRAMAGLSGPPQIDLGPLLPRSRPLYPVP
jgi:hypothetical protein